jgi:serine/threonine protein kinase
MLSMRASTLTPPPVGEEPVATTAPLAAVVPDPDAPADNTVAIAVGVTVPLVVVGAGAAVLAVFLIRRKKKAEKEKTFADKQGAIIQSRKIQIMNKIGSGSFGDVWKGIWKGKEVAVKEVKSGADSSFLNEIKIMAKLPPHDNVMEVYGAIIDADSPSLVLEYCGGGSLDFLLYDSEEPISEEDMLKLALGVARGMEHLHKYNIVHRDLAARNVLLTTNHVPKICDFGMSRTVAERNMSNKTKNDMGPIRWMAPEALTHEYSTKTDIWSYGIVLSEITSRTEPHTDVDPLKIALQIRDEKMTPKISDNCPPALADIMKLCWNPDPNERPEFSKIVELLELVVQKK